MRHLFLIALLASIPSTMFAQHAGFGASHFSGHAFHGGQGFGQAARFSRGPHASLLPWLDPAYSDYLTSTGYPVASEPPVIILQASPAAAAAEHAPSPTQPLLIERRGNEYVQITGDADPQKRTINTTLASAKAPSSPENCHPERSGCEAKRSIHEVEEPALSLSKGSLPALPNPAVLVFRDGHQEEVSDYTITGSTLYASADYVSSGSWTRKVDLTSLNLSDTVNSNRSRGLQFRIPQAPNEVIVGP